LNHVVYDCSIPPQAQADSLLLGLLVFGIAGLSLSAILVATMLNGLFTQHIPQIGIMKATGATSNRLLQFYLLMTLLIAIASTSLAIAPGILISRNFTPMILRLLGVGAQRLLTPAWMYGLVLVAGIAIPLLFSFLSLLKASGTTVREALDYRGVEQLRDISTRFDAGFGLLRGLDRSLLMAFRNIFRHRARFLLSVGLLAAAGAVFVAGMSTMAGFQAFNAQNEVLRSWDVELRLAATNGDLAVAETELVREVPDVTRVEAWSSFQTSIIPLGQEFNVSSTYPDQGHGSITVSVFPADSLLITVPSLLEGRWLEANETDSVVISQKGLAEDFPDIGSGDSIQLSIAGRLSTLQVVGIAESIGGHGGGIFMTQAAYEAATGISQPNLLRLVTDSHDEATRSTVAQAAERRLADAGVVGRSAASVSISAAAGAGHMLPLIVVFLALSIGISIVGFAGLSSSMGSNVLERTREFGIMRAIGASSATVRRLVVLEGIFIALASCIHRSGICCTSHTDYLPMAGLFQISVLGIVIWLVVVMLGAALATLAPAWRASQLTVREALTYL
jgi:putative ABC transport system permease protein